LYDGAVIQDMVLRAFARMNDTMAHASLDREDMVGAQSVLFMNESIPSVVYTWEGEMMIMVIMMMTIMMILG
jgi:hypothetical protein